MQLDRVDTASPPYPLTVKEATDQITWEAEGRSIECSDGERLDNRKAEGKDR